MEVGRVVACGLPYRVGNLASKARDPSATEFPTKARTSGIKHQERGCSYCFRGWDRHRHYWDCPTGKGVTLSECPERVKELVREGQARLAVSELLQIYGAPGTAPPAKEQVAANGSAPSRAFTEVDAERLVFLESLAIAKRERWKILRAVLKRGRR